MFQRKICVHLLSTTLRLQNLKTDINPEEEEEEEDEEDPGSPKENGAENLWHILTRQDPKRQNKSLGKHS